MIPQGHQVRKKRKIGQNIPFMLMEFMYTKASNLGE